MTTTFNASISSIASASSFFRRAFSTSVAGPRVTAAALIRPRNYFRFVTSAVIAAPVIPGVRDVAARRLIARCISAVIRGWRSGARRWCRVCCSRGAGIS
ncbi:hypothetical protein ACFPTO_15275 [Paraburkholderia denitrificans]|uniref:Uncharacterized protein n=1 Tax=Paraburkholderia denitrificans TaxID=694025 RepID=A0ABW0JAU5_9BURK